MPNFLVTLRRSPKVQSRGLIFGLGPLKCNFTRFVSDPLHPLSAATASRCLASTRAAAISPGMGRGSPFPGNQGNAPTSARPPRRVPAEGVLRCPAESAKSFPLHQHFFSRCRQSPLAVVDDDALRLLLLVLLHYHHHHHHLLQFSSTAAASSFCS